MAKKEDRSKSNKVDEELDESFPASDPPSWTLGEKDNKPGSDKDHQKEKEKEKIDKDANDNIKREHGKTRKKLNK